MTERIVLVDEHDTVVGSESRDKVNSSKDIYRCSGLWILNNKGEVLIAQRSLSKDRWPGKWGPSVTGLCVHNESYHDTIMRETMEELGITLEKVIEGPKQEVICSFHYFVQWYFVYADVGIGSLILDPDEVYQVRWISKQALLNEVLHHPENYIEQMEMFVNILP